jgi:2-polyprenyl-3-methyl-5-hydroxy-6-metoxy-1,4-benzoquinol methylase
MAFSETEIRYTKFDASPGSTHNLVVGLVEAGSRVLEFGCSTGYMSQALRDRLGATVVGVELNAAAAELAQAHCDRVLIGDAEELDLEAELGGERFDAILFADVLEHLRDPAALLRRVWPLVAEGGAVVASIPNIAHASVRLALLGGSFRYREHGLLDETHLRFFTREGIQDLFESSGYVISHWVRRRIEPEQTEISIPRGVPPEARAWAMADPEATTYQFVVRAAPSEASTQVQAWRGKLDETQAELHARLDELAGREAEAEALGADVGALRREMEALRRAHEVLQRRMLGERAAFSQAIAAVEEGVYGSRSWRYTAPMRAAIRGLQRLKP